MVKNEQYFKQSLAAGFDGLFGWDFLKGCFGPKIMPMDFDGVVERNGRFLVFETKHKSSEGICAPVLKGQMISLEAARRTGFFTICILWGAVEPEDMVLMTRNGVQERKPTNRETVIQVAANWYQWADSMPPPTYASEYEAITNDLLGEIKRNRALIAEYEAQIANLHLRLQAQKPKRARLGPSRFAKQENLFNDEAGR